MDDLVEAGLLAQVAVVDETATNSNASMGLRLQGFGQAAILFTAGLHDLWWRSLTLLCIQAHHEVLALLLIVLSHRQQEGGVIIGQP